ncbi:MAG: extracellular solute-binding protein [Rhodobacteraceae bacterium]|nr:extracellular solute-binding protein [Paracoccaceae bacterium]
MIRQLFPSTCALALVAAAVLAGPARAEVTLRALMEDVPETAIIESLLPQFTEKTGIKVEFEKIGYGDMHDKLVLQLTSPESFYNLLSVDFLWAGEFPEAGWLEDLGPMARNSGMNLDGFIPAMWDLLGRDGDTIPIVPMYNYSMGLIYRTDLLGDQPLPDTLEGFIDLAVRMKAEKDVVGLAMQGQRGDPNSMEFSNFLFASGADYLDAEGNVVLDSDAGRKALGLYVRAMTEAAQQGALNANLDDTRRLMCAGEAFAMISYWWMLPALDNAADCPAVAGKLALAVVPGGHGESGGWGWGIPKNVSDEEKAAAWAFIEWVQSPEIVKARALAGHAPVQTAAFEDAEVLAKFPYYADAGKVVAAGKSFPIFTYTAQYEDVLGTQLSLAASGQATVEEALAAAAKGLADLMAQ